MALTTIDPTSALVVIDLQKGIVSAHTDDAVTAAAEVIDMVDATRVEAKR